MCTIVLAQVRRFALRGTYCSDGIVNLCPKGRYGSSIGSSVSTCTGWCPAGHYCPAGTAEPFHVTWVIMQLVLHGTVQLVLERETLQCLAMMHESAVLRPD